MFEVWAKQKNGTEAYKVSSDYMTRNEAKTFADNFRQKLWSNGEWIIELRPIEYELA